MVTWEGGIWEWVGSEMIEVGGKDLRDEDIGSGVVR